MDLSILQQQGYGVVELKRPKPNTLTVDAKINGHPALLVVDTGWSGHGITIDSESAGSLNATMSADAAARAEALSGKKLTGYKKGVVDTVSLGNVEMHQVPVSMVYIGGLHDAPGGAPMACWRSPRRTTGAPRRTTRVRAGSRGKR